MKTLKFFSKLLMRYVLSILGMSIVGLVCFILGTYFLVIRFQENNTPSTLANHIIQEEQIVLNAQTKQELEQKDVWLMVLNPYGHIESSYHLPDSLKKDYQLTDIARASRWYLEDYPVFTYVVKNQLLLLGYPKNSYSKIPSNYFHLQMTFQLLGLFLAILLLLLFLSFFSYSRAKFKLIREMQPITDALTQLNRDKIVELDENGHLSDIKRALNQAGHLLQESKVLQSHWIRGISHDLRNPLTLILGKSQQLESRHGHQAELEHIQEAVHQMEAIISNLNLSFLLDSPGLKQEMTEVHLKTNLRSVLAQVLNQNPSLELNIDLDDEELIVYGKASLLERAFTNCLLNSLTHNEQVALEVTAFKEEEKIVLHFKDNGSITDEQIANLNRKAKNYDTHGMGVIITKQIIQLHQGSIHFQAANPGLDVTIILPVLTQ